MAGDVNEAIVETPPPPPRGEGLDYDALDTQRLQEHGAPED